MILGVRALGEAPAEIAGGAVLRERQLREEGEGPTGGPECSAREAGYRASGRVGACWALAGGPWRSVAPGCGRASVLRAGLRRKVGSAWQRLWAMVSTGHVREAGPRRERAVRRRGRSGLGAGRWVVQGERGVREERAQERGSSGAGPAGPRVVGGEVGRAGFDWAGILG